MYSSSKEGFLVTSLNEHNFDSEPLKLTVQDMIEFFRQLGRFLICKHQLGQISYMLHGFLINIQYLPSRQSFPAFIIMVVNLILSGQKQGLTQKGDRN
jgi:hypothetical protein